MASCLVSVGSGFHSQLKAQNSVCSVKFQYLVPPFIEAPFILFVDGIFIVKVKRHLSTKKSRIGILNVQNIHPAY